MSARKETKPPIPPDQLKEEMGLPSSAPFVGYGVQLTATEEFLALEHQNGDFAGWAWTRFPNYAKHFHRYDKASRSAKRYGKGATVVYMFDVGEQYIVGFVD